MALILFVLGLAALIVEEQFGGQHTLGIAFIVIAAVVFLLQILAYASIRKKQKDLFGGDPFSSRNRRGF